MNELWIPILGVICAVGMPVLLGIIASYMTIKSKHEEKMAMIEKGICAIISRSAAGTSSTSS